MTKDRRLGRGLAALLGTPLDESGIVEGTATEAAPAGASQQRPQPRPQFSSPTSQPTDTIKANSNAAPAGREALAVPQAATRVDSTSAITAKPRTVVGHGQSAGVTGSVPLNSVRSAAAPELLVDSHAVPVPSRSLNARHIVSEAEPSNGLAGDMPTSSATASGSMEIDVALIDANPFQPRRQFNEEEIASLAESIKEHQQLQPVLVRKVGQRFQLISGERRLRATIHAGLKTVRAEVREADDRLVAELAIVENLQRKDLNAIEKALSFRRYLDEHHCTQDELAKRLKIDRSTIANLMRLLELPPSILESVQNDRLSAGHARALLPLGEESQQCTMAAQIQSEGWSVRQTEHAVSDMLAKEDGTAGSGPPKGKRGAARTVTPQIGSLEQELRRSLGTKIEIRQSARGRGKIVINFHSAEEFERIRDLLVPEGQRAAA